MGINGLRGLVFGPGTIYAPPSEAWTFDLWDLGPLPPGPHYESLYTEAMRQFDAESNKLNDGHALSS